MVLYSRHSLYGKVTILRHSTDPVARSIAQQELLELMHVTPNIYDAPESVSSIQNSTAVSIDNQ